MNYLKRISMVAVVVAFSLTGCSEDDGTLKKTGGWVAQDKQAEIVVEAYGYLKASEALKAPPVQVGELKDAASRVVEGIEVKLLCDYERSGTKGSLTAHILKDIKGDYQVISIEY